MYDASLGVFVDKATLFIVEGTGAPVDADENTLGMLWHLREKLSEYWRVVNVPYPAAYADRSSYADSVNVGRRNLMDAIYGCDNLFAVAGFSQGAAVAGDICRDIANFDADTSSRCLGVALFADPLRPRGRGVGDPTTGWGVAGERDIAAQFPVWWMVHPGDMITNASPDSMVRSFADFTEYAYGGDLLQWANDVHAKITENSWQNAWGASNPFDILRQIRRVKTACREVEGYLPYHHQFNPRGGQHTGYPWFKVPGDPLGRSHTEWVADQLNKVVTDS